MVKGEGASSRGINTSRLLEGANVLVGKWGKGGFRYDPDTNIFVSTRRLLGFGRVRASIVNTSPGENGRRFADYATVTIKPWRKKPKIDEATGSQKRRDSGNLSRVKGPSSRGIVEDDIKSAIANPISILAEEKTVLPEETKKRKLDKKGRTSKEKKWEEQIGKNCKDLAKNLISEAIKQEQAVPQNDIPDVYANIDQSIRTYGANFALDGSRRLIIYESDSLFGKKEYEVIIIFKEKQHDRKYTIQRNGEIRIGAIGTLPAKVLDGSQLEELYLILYEAMETLNPPA